MQVSGNFLSFMYGCERWTLDPEIERQLQAFECKCYGKLLRIHYIIPDSLHETNGYTRQRSGRSTVGEQESLIGKRRKVTVTM